VRSAPFNVAVRGEPIRLVPLRDALNTQITYSQEFAEWEACNAAHLDVWLWDNNIMYTRRFKGKAIAWYNLHKLIELHAQEEASRELKRKSKSKSF